jgi:mannan endo-1,4-beta-mannosidase
VHNVLYAYSPDFFVDAEHYMRNYPGDDYVDIFGLDYYYRLENLDRIQVDLPLKLGIMAGLAEKHQKIAAFTETGFEAIPNENYWTQMLLRTLNAASAEKRIAYVLVWRNAYHASKAEHFYAPYPGQKSAKDFVAFSQDQRMCFQNNLPKLYKKPKKVTSMKMKTPSAVSEMK